jgi:hypothetical protein
MTQITRRRSRWSGARESDLLPSRINPENSKADRSSQALIAELSARAFTQSNHNKKNGESAMKSAKDNVVDLAAVGLARNSHRWIKALLRSSLPLGSKVVGVTIAEHFINAKNGGTCWASIETIAEACGMKPGGVRPALRLLEAAGFVKIKRRGRQQTNVIALAMPVSDRCPDNAHSGTLEERVTVVPTTSDRCPDNGVTVVQTTPNLPTEHPIENFLGAESQSPTEPSLEAIEGKRERRVPQSNTESVPAESPSGFQFPDLEDGPIFRATSDQDLVRIRIGASAMRLLGIGIGTCPKIGDKYLDRIIVETIPEPALNVMFAKARDRKLMLSDIAAALNQYCQHLAQYQNHHQEAACR